MIVKFASVQVTLDVNRYASRMRQPPPLCSVKYGFIPGIRWIWPAGLPNARQRVTSTWCCDDPADTYNMPLTRPMQFNEDYRFRPVDEDYVRLDDGSDIELIDDGSNWGDVSD